MATTCAFYNYIYLYIFEDDVDFSHIREETTKLISRRSKSNINFSTTRCEYTFLERNFQEGEGVQEMVALRETL